MRVIINEFDHIDVLVNDASIYTLGPVEEFSLNDWQQVIDTNLWGYIHMIHALLPHFLERSSGTIVNISSIGGLDPIPYQVPFHLDLKIRGVTSLPDCFRVLETPEDVAKAIWNGVQHRGADVIVGTAKLWTAMFHLFPGLMKSISRRVFGMKERV